jgi:hypothetical protein
LDSPVLDDEDFVHDDEKIYHIIGSEFDTALKYPKEDKAGGNGGIPSEFLKNAGHKP